MLPPPKKSRAFYSGWKARLAGKKQSACRYNTDWNDFYNSPDGPRLKYWASLKRKQDWHHGYLCCSRALGRERKKIRDAAETIRLNAEHDEMVELAEEFGL